MAKDEFSQGLSRLLEIEYWTDIVVSAGRFTAPHGFLADANRHMRGQFSVAADMAGNGDRLNSNHRLFLVNAAFDIKSISTYPAPSFAWTIWTQVGLIVFDH